MAMQSFNDVSVEIVGGQYQPDSGSESDEVLSVPPPSTCSDSAATAAVEVLPHVKGQVFERATVAERVRTLPTLLAKRLPTKRKAPTHEATSCSSSGNAATTGNRDNSSSAANLRSSFLVKVLGRSSVNLQETLGLDEELVSSFSERTLKALSFDDEGLLRASRVANVLHRCGSVLRDSTGSMETYSLSETTSRIDAFISHTWSTPGFDKFLVLALHFNCRAAVVSALLSCIGCLLVSSLNKFPQPRLKLTGDGGEETLGFQCQLLGVVVFFVVFISWHEVGRCIGQSGASVFLDKTCIHQTDLELKRKGVNSLAGFLCNSKTMLVVYSDVYLQRLWTVYELATFLAMRSGSPIEVLPLAMPKALLVGLPLFALLNALALWSSSRSAADVLQVGAPTDLRMPLWGSIIASLPMLVVAIFGRWWARGLDRIHAKVARFSIRDALCYDESDRAIVQGNVASFMKDVGFVLPTATEEDALQGFDALVHEDVPDALAASLGVVGVNYSHVVVAFMSETLSNFDRFGERLVLGDMDTLGWLALSASVAKHLFVYPIIASAVFVVLRRNIQLHGFADVLYTAGSGLAGMAATSLSVTVLEQLRHEAAERLSGLVAFVGVVILLLVMTVCIYRKPPYARRWRFKATHMSAVRSHEGRGRQEPFSPSRPSCASELGASQRPSMRSDASSEIQEPSSPSRPFCQLDHHLSACQRLPIWTTAARTRQKTSRRSRSQRRFRWPTNAAKGASWAGKEMAIARWLWTASR
eukprot:TRINITY_DN11781_c0_g1_i2.p1 TRINITY_DN11781_c0_g1~~TRINITY_DN11781_c0_g1_i2.p1  ORF type:complete len:757 (-),score=140.16 TRINITY_DN11781_c0_g1_i2:446-2716(-)